MSLVKEIKKVPASIRLKTKIEIYNLILKNQTAPTQPQRLNTTDISQSNQAKLYSQKYISQYGYPQYDHPNFTTVPYGTSSKMYTQINQNTLPSPSATSSVSDFSQDTSDLDIFG